MAFTTVDQPAMRNPEARLGLLPFCDWRVFAVSDACTDPNHEPIYGPDDLIAHQTEDGPSYIVVGARVVNERLERNLPALSGRYGVTLEQLKAARFGSVVNVRIEKPERY